jgi:hypothetical protein
MGATYRVTRVSTALNTAQDLLTITAPSNRSLRILEISIGAMGTASAAQEIAVARSTGGATPVAITPVPTHPDFAAATFTAAGGWTTHPTIGAILDRIAVNGNGGGVQKPLVFPGFAIELPATGQVSFRSIAGTGNVVISVLVEQI